MTDSIFNNIILAVLIPVSWTFINERTDIKEGVYPADLRRMPKLEANCKGDAYNQA